MPKVLTAAEQKQRYPLQDTYLWRIVVEGAGRDLFILTPAKHGLSIERANAKAEKWLDDCWVGSWTIKTIKFEGTIDG